MKRNKRPKSMRALTWLLVLSILGTWLVSMACLTRVLAQELYDKLYEYSYDFLERVDRYGMLSTFYNKDSGRYGLQYEHPDLLEYDMLQAINWNTKLSLSSGGNSEHKLLRWVGYPMEGAVLFYDGSGKLLHSSEDEAMFFQYYTQEEWDAGMDDTGWRHYGWIDMRGWESADPGLWDYFSFDNTYHLHGTLRVRGYFEGNQMKPVVLHYVTDMDIQHVAKVDRTGLLAWKPLFDRSGEYPGEDLVNIYINATSRWEYERKALDYDGEHYESLAALTRELDFPAWAENLYHYSNEFRDKGRYQLNDLLIFDGRVYADYASLDYASVEEPETEFILITAIRSHPLSCAISALRNLYIVTGLLALLALHLVRRSISGRFVQPVVQVAAAMEKDWKHVFRPSRGPAFWLEAEQLYAGFAAERDLRRMRENELTRLNTALDYAKTAEENRRQMVSNIAHELKTPLAVIHSYAEGLKEHIAEDKRDKYIDVILSEAERSDAMVLEMLDLSRLEAGKVKLSRDEVSLMDLTRAIFEKLEMAAQAKELQIEFHFPGAFTVTGDESRIAQVIENFATNAIKYTPVGGHIAVWIRINRFGVTFAIENESPPLSEEALGKVWDSFYRTDEARSGGGTGLGLAIAKNIIELHGWKCTVRNTKQGVEFGFTI